MERDVKERKMFDQNKSVGGFESGGYDNAAFAPTNINWTRVSNFLIPERPVLKWKVELGDFGTNSSYPSIAVDRQGNAIIAATERISLGKETGHVVQVDVNGEKKELFSTEDPLSGNVVIHQDGSILVFSRRGDNRSNPKEENFLYHISVTGELIWKYTVPGHITAQPVIDREGNIYIVSFYYVDDRKEWDWGPHGFLRCLSSNGKLKWKREFPSAILCAPTIAENGAIIFALNHTKSIVALTKDRKILWETPVKQCTGEHSFPVNSSGVFFATYRVSEHEEALYALDWNGKIKWSYQPKEGFVFSVPAITETGDLLLNLSHFRIALLDEAGTERWVTQTSGLGSSPPIIDREGNFYQLTVSPPFTKLESWIEVFSKQGEKKWEYKVEKSAIVASAIASDNRIYLLVSKTIQSRKTRSMTQKLYLIALGS